VNVRTEPLSEAELDQYRNEGWIKLGRVVDEAVLAELRAEEIRFRGSDSRPTIFRNQLAHHCEPVRRFITAGPHIRLASQLIGSVDIATWFNQFVTKLPDHDAARAEFPWHQDNGYAAVAPGTNVTIWIALDDVDPANGCVWIVPGSHRHGLLAHHKPTDDNWYWTTPVAGDGIPASLQAGQAVAFSGLTLHRSKQNSTQAPRRAFFVEYAEATATYQRPGQERRSILEDGDTWMVLGEAPWPVTPAAS
jgi:ectoine hydroxylase-related dioxygenase (phytanoyl-CoA dioxygenase family)